MSRKIIEVHISEIKAGNTVLHNNQEMTVGKNDIKRNSFTGLALFGDPYRSGKILVKKVLFPKWYKGKIVAWV